jgi:hypothetical protein
LLLFIYCPSKKGTKSTIDGVITKEIKKKKKEEKEANLKKLDRRCFLSLTVKNFQKGEI